MSLQKGFRGGHCQQRLLSGTKYHGYRVNTFSARLGRLWWFLFNGAFIMAMVLVSGILRKEMRADYVYFEITLQSFDKFGSTYSELVLFTRCGLNSNDAGLISLGDTLRLVFCFCGGGMVLTLI